MEISSQPLVILGGGYTGKIIYRQALKLKRPLFISSRRPELHLRSFPKKEQIWFDLENPESWNSLPENGDIIWTFPPVPRAKVQSFIKKKGRFFHRLLVMGSTSAYRIDSKAGPVIVDESSPIDLTIPRVEGEEYLRKTQGAIILRSAGIYGPGRNPMDWIRQGRFKNSGRYLNLVHVQDLAGISLLALEKGRPGEVYNVSDGIPRQISEIMDRVKDRWTTLPPIPSDLEEGKLVLNHKILLHLDDSFKFSDLYAALNEIEEKASPEDLAD